MENIILEKKEFRKKIKSHFSQLEEKFFLQKSEEIFLQKDIILNIVTCIIMIYLQLI